jgi:hypothetical protein
MAAIIADATVVSSSEVDGSYITYQVKVAIEGMPSYTVSRRFSDFKALRAELQLLASKTNSNAPPRLPYDGFTTYFTRLSQDLRESRAVALSTWLRAIKSQAGHQSCPAYQKFFGSEGTAKSDKQTSSADFRAKASSAAAEAAAPAVPVVHIQFCGA